MLPVTWMGEMNQFSNGPRKAHRYGRWVVYTQGGPNTTPWQKTLWKVSIDGGESVQLSEKPSSGAANFSRRHVDRLLV